MPVPLLMLVLMLTGLVSTASAEDSSYSDALKMKKQIEQMTGRKLAPEAATGDQQQPADPALHLEAPRREAGWWEFVAVGASGNTIGTQHLCVGEASEKVFSAFDQLTNEPMTGVPCTQRDFKQDGAGWSFETTCDPINLPGLGDLTIRAKGNINGDMARAYEVKQTVISAGTTMTGSIKATLKGPCPADRKEGDLVTGESDFLLNVLP
jgi:hypothetical protein